MSDFAKQHSLDSGAIPPPESAEGVDARSVAPLEELAALAAGLELEPSRIKRVLSFYLLARERKKRQRMKDLENAQKTRFPGEAGVEPDSDEVA